MMTLERIEELRADLTYGAAWSDADTHAVLDLAAEGIRLRRKVKELRDLLAKLTTISPCPSCGARPVLRNQFGGTNTNHYKCELMRVLVDD